MTPEERRRPIAARQTGLAKGIAARLTKMGLAPNHISLASIGFAALAALALAFIGFWDGALRILPVVVAVLGIALRLLCNLFDGMVAVEGGKATASGELFNDVPDRIADTLIFIGAGYGTGTDFGIALGFLAAVAAVGTAYVRTLIVSTGGGTDFRGPMAKQHRMWTVAAGAIGSLFFHPESMYIALAAVLAGSLYTAWRRLLRGYRHLEGRG